MASGNHSCLSWPSLLILLPGTCSVPRPPRTYDPNHPWELGRGVCCLPTAGSGPSEPRQRSWLPALVSLQHCASPPGPPALGPPSPAHSSAGARGPPCPPSGDDTQPQGGEEFTPFLGLAPSASTSQALTEPPSGNLLIFTPHWRQEGPQGPASIPPGTHNQQIRHHKS